MPLPSFGYDVPMAASLANVHDSVPSSNPPLTHTSSFFGVVVGGGRDRIWTASMRMSAFAFE